VKVLFDTSVLVAALVEAHPMHQRALPWMQRAKAGEITMVVTSHSVAKLYAVLTALPVQPRITAALAWQLIHENIARAATMIALSWGDYRAVIKQLPRGGIVGGVIYDALIVRAAQKARAARLVTLNPTDFQRVWPDGHHVITAP